MADTRGTAEADPVDKTTDGLINDVARKLAPYNRHVLLTGAGFSKPWKGYLAGELWGLIVSDPIVRKQPAIDKLLHSSFQFEDALAAADVLKRTDYSDDDRKALREATMRAFDYQDRRIRENPDTDGLFNGLRNLLDFFHDKSNVTNCLFTLNQDLLMERFLSTGDSPRIVVPGVADDGWSFGRSFKMASHVLPAGKISVKNFAAEDFLFVRGGLSYVKLHGSMNWRKGERGDVVVLGGAKEALIKRFKILRMNNAIFRAALTQGNARLLVYGYGFADSHINEAIAAGVDKDLKIWIVDTRPPSVTFESLKPHDQKKIWPAVIGYSPGPLEALFDPQSVEHQILKQGFLAV